MIFTAVKLINCLCMYVTFHNLNKFFDFDLAHKFLLLQLLVSIGRFNTRFNDVNEALFSHKFV